MTDPFDTSALDEIFGVFTRSPAPPRAPRPVEADGAWRSAMAALKGDLRPLPQRVAEALAGATLTLRLSGSGERVVNAMVAVAAGRVSYVREHLEVLAAELGPAIRLQGWELAAVHVAAADPGAARRVAAPKRFELVEAIAATVSELKSYDVAEYCDRLGLPDHPNPAADPFSSKRMYVRARIQSLEMSDLVGVAGRVLADFDDLGLEDLVARARGGGVPVKNLVFGSLRKPDLVLLDALSNDLGLVNPHDALLFDGDIPDEGLTWRRLVQELLPREYDEDPRAANGRLYGRLLRCLASPPEQFLFAAYRDRYRTLGVDQPALLPQVWLHYDPKSARQRDGEAVVATQRMDFLLLLSGRRRVVLEVDGALHYSDNDGRASPRRYAAMARGDRELRLAGYEVYRFGGAELPNQAAADELLQPFFDRLIGT